MPTDIELLRQLLDPTLTADEAALAAAVRRTGERRDRSDTGRSRTDPGGDAEPPRTDPA